MSSSTHSSTQGSKQEVHAKIFPRCTCGHPVTMHGENPGFEGPCDNETCPCKTYNPSRPIEDRGRIA